jgi:hypothetical protein
MKYTAILREKGSNYYVKRVDSDYSSKASYAKDCRANGYYVGGIFTDAEIDLIVNGFNSDDLETWRKSLEFREKFSERILSCFTDGCPDISEPKETAEPEHEAENAEEQEAEEEHKEQKNELFAVRVESIQNGTQRTIDTTLKRYNQLKEDLESMQEDIADGFYTEDEPCYLKAKEEFEWLEAVIKESGLDKPKAEPERKWGLFTDYIGRNLVETFRTEKEAKKALKSYGFMKHSEAWVEEVEEKETCRPPPEDVWNQGTRNESKYQLKGLIECH